MVDATDKILGRLASTIAIYIRGKDLPTYTPSVDMGAYVIVVGNSSSYNIYIFFIMVMMGECVNAFNVFNFPQVSLVLFDIV